MRLKIPASAFLMIVFLFSSFLSQAKTVGIFKDIRSYITEGMVKTLQDAGWTVEILEEKKQPLENKAVLDKLDVLFLPNGWQAYFYASFNARLAMNEFLASGKGILAGAFRSGYVRSATRPLLPEIASAHNRVNGVWVSAYGNSELAKAIDQPFASGGWDHIVLKVGPLGKIFATCAGNDPVGVYGEIYGGRYVALAIPIGIDSKTEPMQGTPKNVLLKTLDWLASAPAPSEAQKKENLKAAELAFFRRELIWDWTLSERGPDNTPGIIPEVYAKLDTSLEGSLFTLRYFAKYLTGKNLDQANSLAADFEKALKKLNENYKQLTSDTIASINKMSLDELKSENIYFNSSDLMTKMEASNAKNDPELSPIIKQIQTALQPKKGKNGELIPVNPIETLKKISTIKDQTKIIVRILHRQEIQEKLFQTAELEALKNKYNQLINILRPELEKAKNAKLAEEHKTDLARLPEITKTALADSADINARRDAVDELGRIGDASTATTLIKLLSDPDEKIKISSIQALAWMQSKEAVPALIKLAESKDPRIKARATQALGQIGDPRAIPAVLANIDNPDFYIAENAILSAGWLKAKEALPKLLDILAKSNPQKGFERLLMLSAIRSIGHIGDESALPKLKEISETLKDWPTRRHGKGGPVISNIYSSSESLGLKVLADLAINEISKGGQQEPGIKQPEYLSSARKFYALSKNFNALCGRVDRLANATELFPVIKEAGFTGIHNAWGSATLDPQLYMQALKIAGDMDLIWIDVKPLNVKPYDGPFYNDNPYYGIEKSIADFMLESYKDKPAFTGFWFEETYPVVKTDNQEFSTWINKKYGTDYRTKLGLTPDFIPECINKGHSEIDKYSGPLKTEYLEFCGERIFNDLKEAAEWTNGLRKGCVITNSISQFHANTNIGLNGPVNDIIVNGPESYQSFGHDNAFILESYKNGRQRPVMFETYNWYSVDSPHELRGYFQSLMHGECEYNFAFEEFAKFPTNYLWSWDNTRWENLRRTYQKAEKIKDYINVPQSASNVAMLCSEATAATFGTFNNSLGNRWYQQQSALWNCISQMQISCDVIWTETLKPEYINRYSVIVMSDAKILTDTQQKIIRDWVNKGGVLIASGTSSLFDKRPARLPDYMLADVFGVKYDSFKAISDESKIDSYSFAHGKNPFKVTANLELPAVKDHVHRELKPKSGLEKYTVSASTFLPGIKNGTSCEYDMSLGYDKVSPKTAEVLAKFPDGSPALTVNKFGSGLSFFWTPIYPGLSYLASDWEMQANKKDFWPNVKELLESMIKGGLAFEKKTLPLEISGVSKEIEVTIRQQPDKNRMIVHLLNYDSNLPLVKAPKMTLYIPEGKTIKKIFYPDTNTDIKFTEKDGKAEAVLRDFDVHDMAVIQY